jgi:hypothetical protein
MAKILSLRLNYKGKFLDYAKEGKEIKKSFTIGSNKFLQWQILDPSFPDKHMFIQQKGGEYVMQLLPGAQLSCEKGGNSVDSNYLKQNNLLSGNELVLKQDIKGTLTLAPNWDVEFEYREPWVAILTAEEMQIVAQYARREKPDAVSRFNRMVLWLVILLSIAFLIIFDLFLKKEYIVEETIAQRLQNIQAVAQRVTPDLPTTGSFEQPAPVEAAETGETAQQGTPGATGTPRGSSAFSAFAGGFDPNATGVAPDMNIVTVMQGFSARRPGGAGGGGTGDGPGGSGPGAGSTFSASAVPQFGDVGAVAQRAPSGGGYDTRPEGAVGAHITGDASTLAPSGKAWGDVVKQQQIARDYAARNVVAFKEGSVAGLDEAGRALQTTLREQVDNRKNQIDQAYRQANLRTNVSFSITLFISPSGVVRESIVVPAGSYPESFVARVKSIVDAWKFNVPGETQYTFSIRLRAQ